MRLNQFLAKATGVSRRQADELIKQGRVMVNNQPAQIGARLDETDKVQLDKTMLETRETQTVLLNKPVGYVCSREGQGSHTIYDLLPKNLQHLKPIGRLDKDSSGLLLLTNDGDLAQQLTHPSFEKQKIYTIALDKELTEADFETITKQGVKLEDGLSKFALDFINDQNFMWKVTMHEGRNRQIRRTFEALGYQVLSLHRIAFGPYHLDTVGAGKFELLR